MIRIRCNRVDIVAKYLLCAIIDPNVSKHCVALRDYLPSFHALFFMIPPIFWSPVACTSMRHSNDNQFRRFQPREARSGARRTDGPHPQCSGDRHRQACHISQCFDALVTVPQIFLGGHTDALFDTACAGLHRMIKNKFEPH